MGHKNKKAKLARADEKKETEKPAEYKIEGNVRNVLPYVHTFTAHAKGRWVGRLLLEVVVREFGSHSKEYWENAIKNGFVKINGKMITNDYIFKNSDYFYHMTHRHEPAVVGNITYV